MFDIGFSELIVIGIVALVVIGHTMTTARTGSALGYAIYSYIYLFHMPAMIALSGLFSKPEATPKAVLATCSSDQRRQLRGVKRRA